MFPSYWISFHNVKTICIRETEFGKNKTKLLKTKKKLIIFGSFSFSIPEKFATFCILPSSNRVICCSHLFLHWNWISQSAFVFLNIRSPLCIISQNFLETCEIFFKILQRLSARRKNYPTMSWSIQVESKILGNFQKEDFEMVVEKILWIILFFICCVFIIKKLRKVCRDA